MASRVYLLLVLGELNVKGIRYSRRATPTQYWLTTVLAVFGTVFAFAMAAADIAAIVTPLSGGTNRS